MAFKEDKTMGELADLKIAHGCNPELAVKEEQSALERAEVVNGYDSKEFRKFFNLPKKKKLVYYHDKTDEHSKTEVKDVRVVWLYNTLEDNSHVGTLDVTLIDGTVKRINSMYFASMQSSSFVEDMKETWEE